MITSNKIISIIKKNNLPYNKPGSYTSYGFSVRKEWGGDEVEITYLSGTSGNYQKEIDNFNLLAQLLQNAGENFIYKVGEYGDIHFYFNQREYRQGLKFDKEGFIKETNPYLEKDIERKNEEKKRQQEQSDERERIYNLKHKIAIELNPDLKYTVLHKVDDNNFIGHAALNTQEQPVFMQFSARKSKSWEDSSEVWNLDFQPMQWNGNRFSGGSSSGNGFQTIEEGLLDYIITWDIRILQDQ